MRGPRERMYVQPAGQHRAPLSRGGRVCWRWRGWCFYRRQLGWRWPRCCSRCSFAADYTAAGGHARVAPGMALPRVGANPRGLSRLAALGLEIHDRMPGKFLAFAGVGKEPVDIVAACSGQFILDAPDFLKHHVAAALNRWFFDCFHLVILRVVLPACKS